jgi:hypothetical protein
MVSHAPAIGYFGFPVLQALSIAPTRKGEGDAEAVAASVGPRCAHQGAILYVVIYFDC